MQYQTLNVGDVRQAGDEVRCTQKPHNDHRYYGHPNDATCSFRPTNLLGHSILSSDLIHLEFRRLV